MRFSSKFILLALLTVLQAGAAELGSAAFLPTAENPIGWRGDWTGRYPGATPPMQWSRRAKAITSELFYQAKKPAGEALSPDARPLEYFTIKDWLLIGPFECADPKADIEKDFLGGEANVLPNEGDKVGTLAWKYFRTNMDSQTTHIHNGGMCGHLNIDYVFAFGTFGKDDKGNFKVDTDLSNKVGYAHTYVFAPNGGKVNLTDLNWGAAAKAWLNGQPLNVVVETNSNVWNKKEITVTLNKGWNRLLVKVSSNEGFQKTGGERVSRWRSAVYLSPILPVSYETKNVAWMTRVTGRSMSQPIVVGDKIFIGAGITDLMCFSKIDGRVLWLRSNTPWDSLSADEKSQHKDIEVLVVQLEKVNEETVAAINAAVSPQGMSTDQQEALDKKLKARLELESKIHKEFEKVDRKRFPPMFGNEVASSNATPCSDGKFVYWACGGGMKGPGASVVCSYDLNGKLAWSYHEAFGAAEHGLHTSPFLAGGKLVYGANRWLVAFDAATGKVAWKQPSDEYCGSSPQPVKIGNEIAIFSKHKATLNRLSDGAKIGFTDMMGFGDETPVVDHGLAFVPDKFSGWNDANVLFTAYQLPTAVADKAPVKQAFKLDWARDHVQLRGISYWVSSPLFFDGLVYTMDMSGGFMVVDVQAQKSVYKQWLDWYCRYHRFLYGAVASPTLGGKNIYLVDNAGSSIILKPGPVYQELGRNIIENISPSTLSGNPCKQEAFYTSPVFSDKMLYLRGEEYLYAILGTGK